MNKLQYLISFIVFILIVSCSQDHKDGKLVINLQGVELNSLDSDYIPNTILVFELSILNESSDQFYFIVPGDSELPGHRSTLIIRDTITDKFVKIETSSSYLLKENDKVRSYGLIDLSKEGNIDFWGTGSDLKKLVNDRNFVIEKVNEKLKSCRIYYTQTKDDIDRIKSRTNYDINYIKDTLKAEGNYYVTK